MKSICPNCGTAVIQGDRSRLKQIIVNLLDNAIRFTPRGARCRCELRRMRPAVSSRYPIPASASRPLPSRAYLTDSIASRRAARARTEALDWDCRSSNPSARRTAPKSMFRAAWSAAAASASGFPGAYILPHRAHPAHASPGRRRVPLPAEAPPMEVPPIAPKPAPTGSIYLLSKYGHGRLV